MSIDSKVYRIISSSINSIPAHGDGDFRDIEGSVRRQPDIDRYGIRLKISATLRIFSAMTAIYEDPLERERYICISLSYRTMEQISSQNRLHKAAIIYQPSFVLGILKYAETNQSE